MQSDLQNDAAVFVPTVEIRDARLQRNGRRDRVRAVAERGHDGVAHGLDRVPRRASTTPVK